MLDLAVLGLLKDQPLHGYELKKRLSDTLGFLWGVSYGSLYPALRRLERDGAIENVIPEAPSMLAKRARGSSWTAASPNTDCRALLSADQAAWNSARTGISLCRVCLSKRRSSSKGLGRPSNSAFRQATQGGALRSQSRGRRLSRSQCGQTI